MTKMATKKEYIQTVRLRYKEALSKQDKSLIINEVVANLKKSRKHIIKILNGKYYRIKRRRHITRPEIYPYYLNVPLAQIWTIAGKPCSKNLQPQIPELIRRLEQFKEINLCDKDKKLLCKMSTFTIDSLLKSSKHKSPVKGISGTKRSPLLKGLIPVRTNFDEIKEPGHVEQDCVLHCGASVSGKYAETLNTLDIQTHWNEQTAFLKKTRKKVIGAFHEQRRRFPFKIKSTDFDNGYEFVNWSLKKYCDREKIDYTRSRSYQKNDQAHIEERNGHRIRQYFGYDRIEDQRVVDLLNDIYQNEFRLLNNFFYATRKLKSKVRVDKKIRKKYGKAMTPYHRVIESKSLGTEIEMNLIQEYNKLNPAELNRKLIIKLKVLNEMVMVSKINLATTPV